MAVYKYINKAHLKDFKDNGVIFISTLHSFWSAEQEIRDTSEGQHITEVVPEKNPVNLSHTKAHYTFPNVQFNDPRGMEVNMNSKVVGVIDVGDTFVFCASLKYSEKIRLRLKKEAHFRILDIDAFAYTLFEALHKEYAVECYKVENVRYSDKPITVRNQDEVKNIQEQNYWSICFTKDRFFSWQDEIRIVFPLSSNSKEIKPVSIQVPELRRYCRF